jgi:hypothetical protein
MMREEKSKSMMERAAPSEAPSPGGEAGRGRAGLTS